MEQWISENIDSLFFTPHRNRHPDHNENLYFGNKIFSWYHLIIGVTIFVIFLASDLGSTITVLISREKRGVMLLNILSSLQLFIKLLSCFSLWQISFVTTKGSSGLKYYFFCLYMHSFVFLFAQGHQAMCRH